MKTMKKHIHSIVWLACMAVVLSACTKTEGIDNLPGEAGGNLQLNFTIDEKMVSGTKADTYDPLTTSTLRIYQVESDGAEGTTERLIRKYKPANDVPTSLYLVSGTYKVTVEAGDGSEVFQKIFRRLREEIFRRADDGSEGHARFFHVSFFFFFRLEETHRPLREEHRFRMRVEGDHAGERVFLRREAFRFRQHGLMARMEAVKESRRRYDGAELPESGQFMHDVYHSAHLMKILFSDG